MSATRSEYLDSPPLSNGQSNGHKKVFELAPVKGPEEAELEYIREFAPKLRRKIREDEALSGGAKFFYMALLDDSFMWKFGGNGRGQLWVTVQDLAERYKHDRKTIEAWRFELCERRWVWYRKDWPFPEWRITNLCPAPETRNETAAAQMSLGRAASEEAEARNGKVSHTPENGQFPSQVPDNGNGNGRLSQCNWEKTEVQPPKSPSATASPSPVSLGESPGCTSEVSQSLRHTSGNGTGKVSQSARASLPVETRLQPTPARAKAALENTPRSREIGAEEPKEGKAPPATNESAEKILWNGRHWFPSALHKQLSLLDQAIGRTQGVQRRELTALRNGLLSALGIPTPTARTATPPALVPAKPAKILPKAELDKWITDLRGAVQ